MTRDRLELIRAIVTERRKEDRSRSPPPVEMEMEFLPAEKDDPDELKALFSWRGWIETDETTF